ncbi:MAG: hypothetical protein KC492_17105 [Myxococcales bacterium]|nr:hypothetical protein [Myxococcales bacterium]
MGSVQSHTLLALVRAEELGLTEATHLAVSNIDPLLRGRVKRNMGKALATARADLLEATPEHVLQAAFLQLHPRGKDVDIQDPVAVSNAFAELRSSAEVPRSSTRAPSLVVFVGLALLVLATAGIVIYKKYNPTPEDAFLATPLGKALDKPLTGFVVAIDKAQDTKPFTDELLSPAVQKQTGDDAYNRLSDVVSASIAMSKTKPTEELYLDYNKKLNALNLAFTDAKVPAFLYAYLETTNDGLSSNWLMAYVVRRRFSVKIGSQELKVMWGKRIDRLNFNMTATGLLSPGHDFVMLPIEYNEYYFLDRLLLPSGTNGTLGLDIGRDNNEAVLTAGRKAAPLVFEEIVNNSEFSQDDAEFVANELKRRDLGIQALRRKNYRLRGDVTLRMPEALVEQLDEINDPDAQQIVKAADRLEGYQRQVDSALTHILELQEREFVVEQLEKKRLDPDQFALPEGAGKDSIDKRAFVSSRLLLLMREQPCPRIALWRVAASGLSDVTSLPRAHGGAFVLSLLGHELGLLPKDQWLSALRRERTQLAQLTEKLFDKSPAEIQKAAAAAYDQVFKSKPPEVVVTELGK